MTSRIFKVVLLIGVLTTVFLFLWPRPIQAPVTSPLPPTEPEKVEISFKNRQVQAEIASTTPELVRGLSGRDALAPDTGMWFEFGWKNKWGIWMKEMRFPIDIIWFDENLSVVTVAEKISPQTYPKIFYPTNDARFVLEVPSGFVENSGLKVGDSVSMR